PGADLISACPRLSVEDNVTNRRRSHIVQGTLMDSRNLAGIYRITNFRDDIRPYLKMRQSRPKIVTGNRPNLLPFLSRESKRLNCAHTMSRSGLAREKLLWHQVFHCRWPNTRHPNKVAHPLPVTIFCNGLG